MFCIYCGGKNNEYQRYCGFCGSPLGSAYDEPNPNFYVHKADYGVRDVGLIRQKELKKIEDLISYFSVQQKAFDDYDSFAKSITEMNRLNAKGTLIWSIIVFGIAVVGTLQAIGESSALMFFLLASSIGAILLIVFFSLNQRRRVNLEYAVKGFCNCGRHLSKCYYSYKDCPVGLEYTNPYNLAVIRGVIISGRADTIKDALNILIEAAQQNRKIDYPYMATEYLVSIRRIPPISIAFRGGKFFGGMY